LEFGLAEQKGFAKEVKVWIWLVWLKESKRQKLNGFDIIAENKDIAVIPDENFGILLRICN
jgi:hypothetical protein